MNKLVILIIIIASLHHVIADENVFASKNWICKKRVMSGKAVSIKKHKYHVTIQSGKYHGCGGVILSPEMILTAAECVNGIDTKDVSIRAGSAKWNSGGQVIMVEKVINHPKYAQESYENDISILKLKDKLKFGETVGNVTIWTGPTSPGIKGSVAIGYGALTRKGPSYKDLRETVMRYKDCTDHYDEEEITASARLFCAGGGKSCEGEMGNPLLNKGVLVGISTWGYRCDKPCVPGIYADVDTIKEFITNPEPQSADRNNDDTDEEDDDEDTDNDDDDDEESETTDDDEESETTDNDEESKTTDDDGESETTDDDEESETADDDEDSETTDDDKEESTTAAADFEQENTSTENFIISSICFVPRLILSIFKKIIPIFTRARKRIGRLI
ncbi:hypothetical protein Trydic_g21392 [Trypoxylus dichotomus]